MKETIRYRLLYEHKIVPREIFDILCDHQSFDSHSVKPTVGKNTLTDMILAMNNFSTN